MKIAITGASGFIGKRFIELYNSQFQEVISLTSKTAPLNNINLLENLTKGTDIIIHTAFDHYYQFNQVGLDNIITVCNKNKIKKLIFISSVSVYDPTQLGTLNEDSLYSKLLDPYSVEKQKLENKLLSQPFDVIILQPTIVYGIGGNWTNFAINACKHNIFYIPNRGEHICNAVYVDDVAYSILKACNVQNVHFAKILISGKEKILWKDFYKAHHSLLLQLKKASSLHLKNTKNEFHNNPIIDSTFNLWYNTSLGGIINIFIKPIKILRKYFYPKELSNFTEICNMDTLNTSTSAIGITRKIHSTKFSVSTDSALRILDYQAQYSLEMGINKMLEEILND